MKHSRWPLGFRWGTLALLALHLSSTDLQGQFLTAAEARLAEAVAPPPLVRASHFAAARVSARDGQAGDEAGDENLKSRLAAQADAGGVNWAFVIFAGGIGAAAGALACGSDERRSDGGWCAETLEASMVYWGLGFSGLWLFAEIGLFDGLSPSSAAPVKVTGPPHAGGAGVGLSIAF